MRALIIAAMALLFTANAAPIMAQTASSAPTGFSAPTERTRVVLMPPNIRMSLKTAGGLLETRADWTSEAQTNLINALNQIAFNYGHQLVLTTPDIPSADTQSQLILLHDEVRASVEAFDPYSNVMIDTVVPSKADRADWTLGAGAAELANIYAADLALFITCDAAFSGSGRNAAAAAQVAALVALSVAIGGVAYTSPMDMGFSASQLSLVDLRTGDIIWMRSITSGDPRTPEGAEDIVDRLTADAPL